MRYLWITIFVLGLIAMAAGPRLWNAQPRGTEELVIISPHWDGLRREFGRAFEEHYLKKTGRPIHVEWLDIGGTGEVRKFVEERFTLAKPTEGIQADIYFGGGMDVIVKFAEKGFLQPCPLPPEIAAEIPESLHGQIIRDKQSRYYSSCLSGYGIVWNTLVVERVGLPKPESWEVLGGPQYRGWVSCGTPSSGSLHMAFEILLQGEKWERGWVNLARMFSNVRSFNEGAPSVPRDVSLGQAAAGPCIDFYATAPIRRQGAKHLRFTIPRGLSVATPDPIAMFRSPPNLEAAREFIYFVQGRAGQTLWYAARGEPGGPKEYDLERLPVMPSVYESGLKTHTVSNPFKDIVDFKYSNETGSERWVALNDLWQAVILDTHEEMWSARGAVIAAGRDGELGELLCRAPISEKQLAQIAKSSRTADKRNALRNKWTRWAREWYSAIERAAKTNGKAPEFAGAPAE